MLVQCRCCRPSYYSDRLPVEAVSRGNEIDLRAPIISVATELFDPNRFHFDDAYGIAVISFSRVHVNADNQQRRHRRHEVAKSTLSSGPPALAGLLRAANQNSKRLSACLGCWSRPTGQTAFGTAIPQRQIPTVRTLRPASTNLIVRGAVG